MKTLLFLVVLGGSLWAQTSPRNVVVFRESGRFGGWPANHGIWIWGDEIVVGFETGYFKPNAKGHAIDYTKPAEHVLARSVDGGETWAIERPAGLKPPAGVKIAGVPAPPGGKEPVDSPGGIDFTAPGFALTARMADIHIGPSRFYYSTDRGHEWQGPFRLPDFGQKGIAARTDYLVEGPRQCLVLLTAAKSNAREGRVLCTRTTDGGRNWKFVSFIGPEPEGDDYAIMPSSVRLSASSILTAIRHRKFIDAYRSDDNGATWQYVNQPAPETGGNPPSLCKLRDGRLVLTYGRRLPPYGIRARISSDEGRHWGEEIVLRADGGSWDLGYTRTVQRGDGKMVTVYYFNDAADSERYIGATIWEAR